MRALWLVLRKGRLGQTYNIGGHNQKTNLEVVREICALMDKMIHQGQGQLGNAARSEESRTSCASLIKYVMDRPGHDLRYAIDASKIEHELGWRPKETFDSGLKKTVQWYLENQEWCHRVQDGRYRRGRLGVEVDTD